MNRLYCCWLAFFIAISTPAAFAAEQQAKVVKKQGETINLASFNVSTRNADNAEYIKRGIQAAIDRKAAVVIFPSAGVYKIKKGNYWTIPDAINLQINGNGATIVVENAAAQIAQETYVMAFRCGELNSVKSFITVKNLNISAPAIQPQWTEKDYSKHKLVMAIESDGVYSMNITNCKLSNIYGYGIRLKNFVSAAIDKVSETNVGGHFPIENGFDSYGDGIWLGHYDVAAKRPTRKQTHASITNSTIKAYNTQTNGNFASRCGITVEGFNSNGQDVMVTVDVKNTTVSDYDRNLHVEGIGANVSYTNCKLLNFFGLGLVVNSPKAVLTYNNTRAGGQLKPNPVQERLGLGGVMQFGSNVDLFMTNRSVFSFSGPATFRANYHIQNGSVLDFGNSDVFFDHANLFINSGGSMINIPQNVGRGFNMYAGIVEFNGATISAYDRNGNKASFHAENLDRADVKGTRLNNSKLLFAGKFGSFPVE